MSLHHNHNILLWEDVQEFLRTHGPTMYDETTALTADQRVIVVDAYMLWFLASWDTLDVRVSPMNLSWIKRWLIAISSIPVSFMVALLKDASSLLLRMEEHSYESFKQILRKSYPMIGAVLAPIKGQMEVWFDELEPESFHRCYSWLCFISRLNLPDLSQLEAKALDSYLMIEDHLASSPIKEEERIILEGWFPRSMEDIQFLKTAYFPSHGPGSTADAGRSLISKYEHLGIDSRIQYLLNQIGDVSSPYPRKAISFQRKSKTIFVPKSLGSYRTISMEPSTLMWHQKGVRSAILSLLKWKGHYLLRRYRPMDQDSNRYLAWLGSLDGSFSTIDLSSASDTVSWSMVKRWFGNTSLYPGLLCTRSTHTQLPDGREIKLRKFAPMGSDLSFTIETIIFCAITEASIRDCGGDPVRSSYRVYGDDIVVETEYAERVLQRLQENGFFPNWDKSFFSGTSQGFFRESCGGFYLNGHDVTPIRLSRRFTGYRRLKGNGSRIEALVDLCNSCNSYYPSVRRWLVIELNRLPIHQRIPFSSDGDFGLFSKQPSNFHLKKRESARYQCEEYNFGCISSPRIKRDLSSEDILLFEYLRRSSSRPSLIWPEDQIRVSDTSTVPPRWISTWRPLY